MRARPVAVTACVLLGAASISSPNLLSLPFLILFLYHAYVLAADPCRVPLPSWLSTVLMVYAVLLAITQGVVHGKSPDYNDTLTLLGFRDWTDVPRRAVSAIVSPVLVALALLLQRLSPAERTMSGSPEGYEFAASFGYIAIAAAAFGQPSVLSAPFLVLLVVGAVQVAIRQPLTMIYWVIMFVYSGLFVFTQLVYQIGDLANGWSLGEDTASCIGFVTYGSFRSEAAGMVGAAVTLVSSGLAISYRGAAYASQDAEDVLTVELNASREQSSSLQGEHVELPNPTSLSRPSSETISRFEEWLIFIRIKFTFSSPVGMHL